MFSDHCKERLASQAELPPRAATPEAPEPEPAPEPSVPQMVETIGAAHRMLLSSVAAYGSLLRMIESASGEDGQPQPPPVVTWPARLEDKLVEVMTDLSLVPAADLPGVLAPLVNVHARQMYDAARRLHDTSKMLMAVIVVSQLQAANDSQQPPR